jgi:hypothetical protein
VKRPTAEPESVKPPTAEPESKRSRVQPQIPVDADDLADSAATPVLINSIAPPPATAGKVPLPRIPSDDPGGGAATPARNVKMYFAGAKSNAKGKANANSKNSTSSKQQGQAEGKAKVTPSGKDGQSQGVATAKRRARETKEGKLCRNASRAAPAAAAAVPQRQLCNSCARWTITGGQWLHAVGGEKAQLMKQSRSWMMMTCSELGLNGEGTKSELAAALSESVTSSSFNCEGACWSS